MKFLQAESLQEALAALADGARPVAGGSDLVVGARHGKAPLPDSVVAIDRLDDLGGIQPTGNGTRIGALVTHAELMLEDTIVARHTALADAAALVGSPATRNVGTLGGNVMNASPAMDTGAPLMTLDASVELQSAAGSRSVPIAELWTGPGQTVAAPDELCTAVVIPIPQGAHGSAYVRLEYRRAMEIAVVGAAAQVTLDSDGAVTAARVALTAVAPTIVAVPDATTALLGASAEELHGGTHASLRAIADAAAETASPISDLRASDAYRRHTVGVMASRAVAAAAARALGHPLSVPVNRSVGVGAVDAPSSTEATQ